MKPDHLIAELSKCINPQLAKDLVSEFVMIRNDCKTITLGRLSIGKFVETVVQILQFLEFTKFDNHPKVDFYLKNLESRSSNLNVDLKIVCNRIARAAYSLRNKRSIAHKGSIDPNIYDLRYIFSTAQWILAEIVRQVMKFDVVVAGKLIEYLYIPVDSVTEDFGDSRLVFGNFTVDQEILILLKSYYPDFVLRKSIKKSLDRRSESSVSKSLTKLWDNKLIHREQSKYKLTQEGFKESNKILQDLS